MYRSIGELLIVWCRLLAFGSTGKMTYSLKKKCIRCDDCGIVHGLIARIVGGYIAAAEERSTASQLIELCRRFCNMASIGNP
ncbi:uncharacterized protein BCR38DRAFT_435586 [Pseudomassariella vexata]|uniref:Uncharacterized protein n=1 Tax=Pseudomassariella vexata TaxID=1141098 RepID=A0A1Y2DUP3_9PEZI|nr:uncharacterized protein BCR38DRAFT_435586 [Pseudomassariella vexata]ORY62981.1 hypothetical protein BCR38DRAFT_435586 [Pseudomassariella vexata]